MANQVFGISHFAPGVDHHEQVVFATRDHQVVQQAPIFVGEETVALFAHRQIDDVNGHQGLQRRCGLATKQAQLAHVRHIKQSGGFAALFVLGHDAAWILHRHVIAGKGHHAGTELQM